MNLTVKYMTQNDCYKAGRKITVRGIFVHSTATPNVMAHEWFDKWNKSGITKCVHAFVDDKEVCQYLPWNYRGWHAGQREGNNNYIGFEICEPKSLDDKEYFEKAWNNAIELAIMLCKEFNLTEKDIVGHYEGFKMGIASNHADPSHWFPRHGKSMDVFREEVRKGLLANEEPKPIEKPVDELSEKIAKGKKYVGEKCKELQEKLNKVGFDCGNVDGDFGVKTYNALIAFQTKYIPNDVDGLAGNVTFGKLNLLIAEMNKPKTPVKATVKSNSKVLAYQKAFNKMGLGKLTEDGILGTNTLASVSKLGVINKGDKNAIVAWIQMIVGCKQDSDYGSITEDKVKIYQKSHKLSVDGKCGKNTITNMLQN